MYLNMLDDISDEKLYLPLHFNQSGADLPSCPQLCAIPYVEHIPKTHQLRALLQALCCC